MRVSLSTVTRTIFAIIVFAIAAPGLVLRSGAPGDAHGSVFHQTTGPVVCPTTSSQKPKPYCYETVTYGSNNYNYITGINNYQEIVGAFGAAASGPYTGLLGSQMVENNLALEPYDLSTESDGSLSTYISGLDSGSNSLSSIYQVGFIQPFDVSGQVTEGFVRQPGKSTINSWTPVQDPSQTSTPPCNITEVTSVFDQRIGVGFYETGSTSPCTKHAFEFYSINTSNLTLTAPFTYVDLMPIAPSGSSNVSAVANGINILGDVVGTMTWDDAGGNPHTGGWIYRNMQYSTFCYTGSTDLINTSCSSASHLAEPTYAMGINFSDVVVGYYTDSTSKQHEVGFAIVNPWKTGKSTTFSLITTDKPNTVLASINQATGKTSVQKEFFTGWTAADGAKPLGIVGVCNVSHCGSITTSGDAGRGVRNHP